MSRHYEIRVRWLPDIKISNYQTFLFKHQAMRTWKGRAWKLESVETHF